MAMRICEAAAALAVAARQFPIQDVKQHSVSLPGFTAQPSIPETAVLEPKGLWNTGSLAFAGDDIE